MRLQSLSPELALAATPASKSGTLKMGTFGGRCQSWILPSEFKLHSVVPLLPKEAPSLDCAKSETKTDLLDE